ncbi:hypothetical protein L1887_36823 [Cichorium endivia]|nr:hypothetical protein L1887_36823 [Cichorium endivia]
MTNQSILSCIPLLVSSLLPFYIIINLYNLQNLLVYYILINMCAVEISFRKSKLTSLSRLQKPSQGLSLDISQVFNFINRNTLIEFEFGYSPLAKLVTDLWMNALIGYQYLGISGYSCNSRLFMFR